MEILPEVEVWYGLPAVRRRLAELLKEQGMTQRAIAEKLGMAESAVSQYLSGKRGGSKLPHKVDQQFSDAAAAITDGEQDDAKRQIMKLLEVLREERVICDIHRQHSPDVPRKCEVCFD